MQKCMRRQQPHLLAGFAGEHGTSSHLHGLHSYIHKLKASVFTPHGRSQLSRNVANITCNKKHQEDSNVLGTWLRVSGLDLKAMQKCMTRRYRQTWILFDSAIRSKIRKNRTEAFINRGVDWLRSKLAFRQKLSMAASWLS